MYTTKILTIYACLILFYRFHNFRGILTEQNPCTDLQDRPKIYTSVFSYLHGDIVALPAFARRCCSSRSISPARRTHSSKPAAAVLLLWEMWAHSETDLWTVAVPCYRPPKHYVCITGCANQLRFPHKNSHLLSV